MTMTSMPTTLWTYRARAVKVVDGDTVDLELDLGRRTYAVERVRLLGVNTPERRGATRAAGDAAKAFVEAWLRQGVALEAWPLVIQTEKDDAFGRYLGMIWRRSDGRCLNDELLSAGHAVPFEGRA